MSSLFLGCGLVAGAYIIGSIPIGYLVSKFFFRQDIRAYGSGNIGATNMARVYGAQFFVPILCLDAGKAYAAVMLAKYFSFDSVLLCALASFLGNIYPIFLSGLGGKGVSTFLGILCAINFWAGLLFAVIWSCLVLLIRRVGIASVVALVSVVPLAWYCGCSDYECRVLVIMSFISIMRHATNIIAVFQHYDKVQ